MCPAVSKKQQQFMGIVHAIQKGEMKPSEATPEARAAAKSMKKKDVEDFAKTKHKGLPEKVPENVEEDQFIDTDEKICPETGKIVKRKHKGFPEKFPKNVKEGNFQGSIAQDARGLNFRTLSDLTKITDRKKVQKIQNDFVKFSITNKNKYKDWYTAWKAFWKQNKNIKEAWINYGEKYSGDNIPVGTKVKVDYGTYKGKMGKVVKDAATDGYSIVKVTGKIVTYDNNNLLIRESLNEKKVGSQDMVKDGLRYAKKKYKYNAKDLKELAKEMLTYIKSGEIEDQPSMEAYIDFRHEETKMDEIKEVIRSVVREIMIEGSTGKEYDEWKNTKIQAKNIFRMLKQKYKNDISDMKKGLEVILKQNRTKRDQEKIMWQEFNKYFKIK